MPRPRKRRILSTAPRSAVYKPAGVPLNDLSSVSLLYEELEALRLSDLESLNQEQAARQMGVSRSTYQRILTRARRQVSLALVKGLALHVEGGTFDVAPSGKRLKYTHEKPK